MDTLAMYSTPQCGHYLKRASGVAQALLFAVSLKCLC